jgi:hypothetical protein
MNVEIVEYATRLLSISGIEKVISIDDDNAQDSTPEELLGVLSVIDDAVLVEVVGPLLGIDSGDRDLIQDKVRNEWTNLGKRIRDELLTAVTPPLEGGAESVALLNDIRATSKLPEIFGDKLVPLTLGEWEKQLGHIVNDTMTPTLVLVDLSFTGEQRGKDEGLRVIANLLRMHPESRIYCGLLTSLYHTSSVHDDWKRLAAEHSLDRERFVLIPKDSLDDDKQAFLALIKLVVMNGSANSLRKAVGKTFEACLKQSESELEKLDVFEFERIICLSSSIEGVWEPDTLLRVLSLFHKALVRKALRNDANVHDSADRLRNLTGIRVGQWGGPTEMEIFLRRLEWFEEASDLAEQHLPLELGDMFRIEGRPNKLYVLVAQPCDLMVRQTGERHQTVKHGLLLEANPVADLSADAAEARSEDPVFQFKLEFFEADRDWRINLRKIHYVNLEVLDLCVFGQGGKAEVSLDDKLPDFMPEAWRARFPKVVATMKKVVERYADFIKKYKMKPEDAAKLAFSSALGNLIAMEVVPESGRVKFDVSRAGRIKQPRAGALLSRYANALARDAFEHDLTRRPSRAISTSVQAQAAEISDALSATSTQTSNPAQPEPSILAQSDPPGVTAHVVEARDIAERDQPSKD